MASITIEEKLNASAAVAWAMLRDVGAADRAFPGVLVASRLDGDVRTVTFASGAVVRERIVEIDDARRRVAYAVIEGRFSHHAASMRIIAEGPRRCGFVWVSDFGPDESEPMVRALVEQGTTAFRRAVEAAAEASPTTMECAGSCACGGVRYRLRAAPMFVNCCHCRDCQRQTGSAFVVNALIETGNIEVRSGAPEPVSVPTESGRPHDVYRCPNCRTALWSDYGRRPGLRFVRVGTLEDAAALAPDAHIFTRSKLPWVVLPAETPAFEVYYDTAALWPRESLARRAAAIG